MLNVHQIALDPNNKQRTFFAKSAGTARFSYNRALAKWKEQYKAGKKPSDASLRRELNAIKKAEYPWMLEVGKCAPQQAIKNLGTAFNRFFKKQGGYPKFKKKGEHDSFRCDNGPAKKGADAVQIKGKKIKIPRLGWVKMREQIRFQGQIKSATVSLRAGRWYVSVTVETSEIKAIPSKNQGAVGIDLGSHHLATLSNSDKFEAPKPYKSLLSKLKRTQRSVSRKKKGSSNRKKEVFKLQKLHARIADLRSECLHQLSCKLTNEFHFIGLEDLNVKGMMSNHCLARTIADLGFYEFRRQLEYKGKRKGSNVVAIDRWFPSSKKCSACKKVNKELQLSERTWECPHCSVTHDRDINAAINILEESLRIYNLAASSAVTACGEGSAGLTHTSEVKLPFVKQELNTEFAHVSV